MSLIKAQIIICSILGNVVSADLTPKTDESKANSLRTGLIFFGIGIAFLVIGVIVLIVIRKAGNGGHVEKGKLFGNTQEILYFVKR